MSWQMRSGRSASISGDLCRCWGRVWDCCVRWLSGASGGGRRSWAVIEPFQCFLETHCVYTIVRPRILAFVSSCLGKRLLNAQFSPSFSPNFCITYYSEYKQWTLALSSTDGRWCSNESEARSTAVLWSRTYSNMICLFHIALSAHDILPDFLGRPHDSNHSLMFPRLQTADSLWLAAL